MYLLSRKFTIYWISAEDYLSDLLMTMLGCIILILMLSTSYRYCWHHMLIYIYNRGFLFFKLPKIGRRKYSFQSLCQHAHIFLALPCQSSFWCNCVLWHIDVLIWVQSLLIILTGLRCKSDHIQEETEKKLPPNEGPSSGTFYAVFSFTSIHCTPKKPWMLSWYLPCPCGSWSSYCTL